MAVPWRSKVNFGYRTCVEISVVATTAFEAWPREQQLSEAFGVRFQLWCKNCQGKRGGHNNVRGGIGALGSCQR